MAHPQYWVDEYLSQDVLQEFLSLVVDYEESTSSMEGIKFLMQQIIEESDLKKLSTRIFPHIEHVSEWLYKKSDQPSSSDVDCPDFESFIRYLTKTIDNVKADAGKSLLGPTGSLHSSSTSVATNVSQAICSLRSNYQGTYDDILIKILAFPFQNDETNDIITLNPLSLEDLESLLEKFTEGREKYSAAIAAGASAIQKQSLLFVLSVCNYNVLKEGQFKLHLKKLSQMMEVLKPPLETVLSDELNYFLCRSYRLPQLKKNLDSLLTTGHLPNKPPSRKGISLEHLLSNMESISKPGHHVIPIIKFQSNPEAHTLFLKLGLTEHYHKKLGLQDALCIRSEPLEMSLKISNPTEPKELPFLALQKLMSFDSQCRSDLMKESRNKGKSDKSTKIHPSA